MFICFYLFIAYLSHYNINTTREETLFILLISKTQCLEEYMAYEGDKIYFEWIILVNKWMNLIANHLIHGEKVNTY